MPSYEAPKEPTKEAKAADKAKPINFGLSNYARATVTCADCSKPRVLFASKALTPNEMDVLEARLDSVIYTCGACELFDDGHPLEKKVFVKSALVCGMFLIEFTVMEYRRQQSKDNGGGGGGAPPKGKEMKR